jgi:HK97 family phage major capsid protein
MSLAAINKARRFGEGTTGSNSAFWADLGAGTPPELLGRSVYEFSTMSSSFTTGQDVVLYGNFSRYFVTDHVRGTMVEPIPLLFDQATGRPNGTRGWLLSWRTGVDTVDPDAFRLLRL